jgi:hypothetical protein
MAQTARNVPPTYPQALGYPILKADACRQASMLRQEFVTDLLSALGDSRESAVRLRLIRLIQSNLKTGLAAAGKAEDLWPGLDDAKEALAAQAGAKPAMAKKHLRLFEQLDKVHHRSLDLLHGSFENIQLILDRLQPADATVSKTDPKPASGPVAKAP